MLKYVMFCQYISTATRSNIGILISLRNTMGSFGQKVLDMSLIVAGLVVFYLCVLFHFTSLSQPKDDKPPSGLLGIYTSSVSTFVNLLSLVGY